MIGFPKPEKRRRVVRQAIRRAKRVTRHHVVAQVWRRDRGRCVRCQRLCERPGDTYPTDPARGEVHDMTPRSLGGDPLSVANNQLLCHGCHYAGPSGAHVGRS